MLFYLITMGLSLFHVSMPILYNASPLGILLNVVIAGIGTQSRAGLRFVEEGARARAPQYLEW